MMKMNRALAALAMVCAVGAANASLVGRDINGAAVIQRDGNGVLDSSAVFLYDDVLNVTWLRNANAGAGSAYDDIGYAGTATDGRMTWANANNWAANLTVGSFGGWRLPTLSQPMIGFPGNVSTDEMASLWYGALGNEQTVLSNTGDFQNLQSAPYWTGLELAADSSNAWFFVAKTGRDAWGDKASSFYALAVRDGDVLAAPIPAAAWLMLSGIGMLGAAARRKPSRAR